MTEPDVPSAKPEQVKCETCKHWIDKSDAQERDRWWFYYNDKIYFCPMHTVKWDQRQHPNYGGGFFKQEWKHINEDGTDYQPPNLPKGKKAK